MTHSVLAVSQAVPQPEGQIWNLYLQCRDCQGGTVAYFLDSERLGLQPANVELQTFRNFFTLVGTAPEMPAPTIIEAMPENVRGPWIEAEHSFDNGHAGTAAMAYRRVMERSLRKEHPDLKGNLADRIKALEGTLPDAIIDMANQVRFLGNDGAHDEDDPDMEDVANGRDFVRLYLVYTYELPARIARAVKAREDRKITKAG